MKNTHLILNIFPYLLHYINHICSHNWQTQINKIEVTSTHSPVKSTCHIPTSLLNPIVPAGLSFSCGSSRQWQGHLSWSSPGLRCFFGIRGWGNSCCPFQRRGLGTWQKVKFSIWSGSMLLGKHSEQPRLEYIIECPPNTKLLNPNLSRFKWDMRIRQKMGYHYHRKRDN